MNSKFSIRDFSNIFALLAIWIFFGVVSPTFVSPRNLSNLSVELAITAVLALGMFLIILTGEIDLAAGSGVGLFGGVAAVLACNHHWPAPAALLVTLIVAVTIWGLMGTLIVKEALPSFIITLAGMLIFKGLHWKIIDYKTVPIAPSSEPTMFTLLTTWFLPPLPSLLLGAAIVAALVLAEMKNRRRRAEAELPLDPADIAYSKLLIVAQIILLFVVVANQYQGIPLPALILGSTAFIIHMLTQHTPFGRHLYAIGGNAEAAAISGIPVKGTIIAAFAIAGSIVGLTGFMQTAYNAYSTSTIGAEMELDAVAACVIGGTSLRGGRGTIAGVLFGALIMASLLNGMTLMAVEPAYKLFARGIVLASAVWMDERMKRA